MKNDIEFPKVKGVSVAIARTIVAENETPEWQVYLINKNEYPLENVLIASKGYGELNGITQKTSILRHLIEFVEAESFAPIERIDPQVFPLFNEYWVSYYKVDGKDIFDKKFLFVPESIIEANLVYIPQLEKEGILHD